MMKNISDLREIKTVLISAQDVAGLDALVAGLFRYCPEIVIYAYGSCYQTVKEFIPRDKVWNNLLSLGQLTRDMETEGTLFEALHSRVFLGLAGRNYLAQHQKLAGSRHIPMIDMVIVNFRALPSVSEQNDFEHILDCIDLPGQAMLSAACSNPCQVAALSDRSQYGKLLGEIEKFKGRTSLGFRLGLIKETSSRLRDYSSEVSSLLSKASLGDIKECFEVTDLADDFLEKDSKGLVKTAG